MILLASLQFRVKPQSLVTCHLAILPAMHRSEGVWGRHRTIMTCNRLRYLTIFFLSILGL